VSWQGDESMMFEINEMVVFDHLALPITPLNISRTFQCLIEQRAD
jgi:hypothetical protein